jgi:hypothetical protein
MDLFSVIISAAGIFFGSAVILIGGSYIAYRAKNKS